MPADVNKTVSISYRADMKDLLNNLKQIPGMTEAEAKKMVKALDRQLKQAEKAAQKAGKNTAKAMDQISASAKKASFNARTLRKDFANIDRLSSEASQALSILSPELGQSAMQVSVLASAMESLGRVFTVSNPLFMAAALASGLVYYAMYSQTEAAERAKEQTEKFNAEIKESEDNLAKLEKQLINIEKAFGKFQTLLNDTTNDINVMTGAIDEAGLQEMKIFEQAQKQALELTNAEEKRAENLRKQRDVRQEHIKLLNEELDKTRKTGARGHDYLKVLEYRDRLERSIAEKQEEVLATNRQLQESQEKIAGGFQDEADELEKILLKKREQEERERRIQEHQRRITENIKEFQKAISDSIKPLSDVDRLLKQQAKATEQAQKSVDSSLDESRKLRISGLKEELKAIDIKFKKMEQEKELLTQFQKQEMERQRILEKNLVLTQIENTEKEQVQINLDRQLQTIDNQIKAVKDRRAEETKILKTMREQLEQEQTAVQNVKSKKERTEKLKILEEAMLQLKEREQALTQSEKQDINTIQRLEQTKLQTQLNGQEKLRQATIELGEVQKQTTLENIELIEKQISILGDAFLKVTGDIQSQTQKMNNAFIGNLQNEIDRQTNHRDKQLKSIEEAEKNGLMTAEQAAKRKIQIERNYAAAVKDEELKIFKTKQQAQISQALIDAASSSVRAFKDYPFPASLGISALAFAAATKQIQMIKGQEPPEKFDIGGMVGRYDVGGMVGSNDRLAPDQKRIQVLRGEAILDRNTVNNLGEDGLRNLQNGGKSGQVVVIQPFRHFDKFVRQANRNSIFGTKSKYGTF